MNLLRSWQFSRPPLKLRSTQWLETQRKNRQHSAVTVQITVVGPKSSKLSAVEGQHARGFRLSGRPGASEKARLEKDESGAAALKIERLKLRFDSLIFAQGQED